MLQSSNAKSYYDPQSFKLVFGNKENQWVVERTDADTFVMSGTIKGADNTVTGGKYSFGYEEFLNFAQSLTGVMSLGMLLLDDSSVNLKEKTGGVVVLKFSPAIQKDETQPTKYRPVLTDPAKPENDLPIPEAIAIAITTLADSLNKRL